jgi:hypothetical protein
VEVWPIEPLTTRIEVVSITAFVCLLGEFSGYIKLCKLFPFYFFVKTRSSANSETVRTPIVLSDSCPVSIVTPTHLLLVDS